MKSITKYVSEYLSAKVMLALDIVTSLALSVVTLLVLNFLAGSDYYSGPFALWWLGGSLVFSALMMCLFKTYNVIGSVRHKDRLDFAFRNFQPQVVFHAAAYKHVPLMEENPCEAVFANVHGSRMVADKCVQYGVELMVMISTDKAVNPTNIMGCSKRLAEIYVQSLGLAMAKGKVQGKTKFVTTRFGNVLDSNGSVIPRFREQIENGGPVTGNQIFVFDMGESVKIADLAKRMIELAGLKEGKDIQIEYIGLRPGEKLYEEVLTNTENTEPSTHDRIRIAKVREYGYQEALAAVEELTKYSKAGNIPEMVKLMKKVVPEYKSQNSRFEVFDK